MANIPLPKPILIWLRGESRSIRHRFGTLPMEWLQYGLYRLTGRSWIDFYKNRLDGFATDSIDSRPPSQRYLDLAEGHLNYLKQHGLHPESRMLDYGCGILRLGLLAIPYLSSGTYVGLDISAGRLERGRQLLRKAGIKDDQYELHEVNDCSLKEIAEHQFDFVWAKSVFTHMPTADIEFMLRSLKPRLAAGGQFYFTFSQSDTPLRKTIKDFYFPVDMMRETCEMQGYEFSVQNDWDAKAQGDVMVRLRHLTHGDRASSGARS